MGEVTACGVVVRSGAEVRGVEVRGVEVRGVDVPGVVRPGVWVRGRVASSSFEFCLCDQLKSWSGMCMPSL